jgi:hypothetical protein
VAGSVALPDKEVLLDYIHGALTAADRAVGAVDDQQWLAPSATRSVSCAAIGWERPPMETVGDAILSHLMHDNWHLGEIAWWGAAGEKRSTH